MTSQPLRIALPILGSAAAATAVTVATVSDDFSGLLSTPLATNSMPVAPVAVEPVASLPSPPAPDAPEQGLIVVTGKRGLPSVFVVKAEAEDAPAATPDTAAPLPGADSVVPDVPSADGLGKVSPDEAGEPDEGSDDAAHPPSPNDGAAPAVNPVMLTPFIVQPEATPAFASRSSGMERRQAVALSVLHVPPVAKGLQEAQSSLSSDPHVAPPDGGGLDASVTALPFASAPLPGALRDGPSAASAPLSVHSHRFGEELGIAIARHVARDGASAHETMIVRLDPPEHGRIEVSLSFEDGGPLRAVVAASHSATLDLLRRDSADLARALTQAGVSTDAQSFSFSSQSGAGQQGRAGPSQASPNLGWREDALEDAMPAPQPQRIRTSGSLDLIA